MIIKHISHTDLDGEGCILFAKYYYYCLGAGYKYEYYRVKAETDKVDKSIDDILSNIMNNEHVLPFNEPVLLLITDLSCSEDKASYLDQLQKEYNWFSVCLIDHHRSAQSLNKYKWCTVKELYNDNPTSGCELLSDHFLRSVHVSSIDNNKMLMNLVRLVNDYDSWKWSKTNDLEPVRLNDLLALLGNDKFHGEVFSKLTEAISKNEVNPIPYKYLTMLSILEDNKSDYIKKKLSHMIVYKDSEDRTVGLIESDDYVSEIGEEARKVYPAIDYFAIKYSGGVSLKSGVNRSVDLSELAKSHGGGGHYDSAGYPLDKIKYENYLKELINL